MMSKIHSFEFRYSIRNASNKLLVIKVKGGLSYLVRRTSEMRHNEKQELTVSLIKINLEELSLDPVKGLTKLDRRILNELSVIRDSIMSRQDYFPSLTYDLVTNIELGSSLVEHSDAIHSEMLGVSLYVGEHNIDSVALNTPEHTIGRLSDLNVTKGSMQLNIYLNDPKGVFGTLYTNVLGKSREVPVIKDFNTTPGLYVNYSNNNLPESKYYAFEDLDTSELTRLGLFLSKSDCDKGGNTERFLDAEDKTDRLNKKLTEVIKDLTKTKECLETTTTKLRESEYRNNKLNLDMTQLKHEHKLELANVKISSTTQKSVIEGLKLEGRIKDLTNKSTVDSLKNNSNSNNWTDVARGVATLAGVAFTGYQMFAS